MGGEPDLNVDDYQYLEPDDSVDTLEEYGDFLEQRRWQLSRTAHLYGRLIDAAAYDDGARHRIAQHWERYMDAAEKTRQVQYELEQRGYFREEQEQQISRRS